MTSLGALLERLPAYELKGDPRTTVAGVEHDSRRVVRGSMFIAIRGQRFDGHQFAGAAAAQGAAALVVERWLEGLPAQIAQVRVEGARAVLPVLAAGYYGDPSSKLAVIGVTGTNGKTTVTYLLESILAAAGLSCGVVGTVSYRYHGREIQADRTTPEASDLQRLLAQMVEAGCRAVAMEVASHALAMGRVDGCRFAAAIFTNLTRDHLDFHGDLDSYFAAKRRLFTMLDPAGLAILNADDPRSAELARATAGRVIRYGAEPGSDLRLLEIEPGRQGLRLRLDRRGQSIWLESPLLGRVNAHNIAGAAAAALALGAPPEAVAAGVAALRRVPGRCERVDRGQPFLVVVDYAHTEDGLRKLLTGLRELGPRRLIAVFGCGGDRDRGKRPRMGAAATELADLAVLTSDNPRSEDPLAILHDVLAGVAPARRAACLVEPDRRAAIGQALERAGAGDIVAIAGKGHEQVQIVGAQALPFDDREVTSALLEQLGWRG